MELKDYRTQLANLDIHEQTLRDLYLRNLALGKIQGPTTGYASIDKPWLKYFDEESIQRDFKPMSIYQLMTERNLTHEKEIAISYFGRKISYGELQENIDKVAKSLISLGVQKGDIVMMSMPNTPEAEYLFYAINKIGAIINSIDPRVSQDIIKKDIIDSKAKFFFTVDVIYNKVKELKTETSLENIIVVSPYISLPFPLKQLMQLKNKKTKFDTDTIEWDQFLQLGKNSQISNVPNIFEENRPAVIVHTGGSTGIPKGVMLSNENFNGLIYQQMYSNMGFERNKRFLNILPPFIALGLNNAMHLSACLGLESIMIPAFEPEDFPKLILKNKPNIVLGGPIHWNILMNSPLMEKKDLSYLEICCSGGDKMPKETQEKIQNFLKQHHAKANIWLGYGATETSAGTTCVKDDCFRFESVGAPYLKNVLKVCDSDTGKEVQGYNKIGELKVNAPTIMMNYFGVNDEEMAHVIETDEYGKKWYKTGDIAHFDNDGMVYIDGRIKRIITRRGFKIYPSYVESLILKHPAVKECAVVGVSDPDELNIPVANIVLNTEFNNIETQKEVIDFVDKMISQELPEYSIMAGYNFLDSLPKTPIGKLDFKALEKMGILQQEKKLQKKFSLDS